MLFRSEDKLLPNAGSFLHAHKVPPEGGDTLWADMYRAWETLPEDIKRKVLGKRARFSRADMNHIHYPHEPEWTEAQKRARPDVWHPIARCHPRTGRTALYVGRWACDIEGMDKAEGRALIQQLQEATPTPGAGLLRLSPRLTLNTWAQLEPLRQQAAAAHAEGLMLKALASPYLAGRKRGHWWKHKRDPYTLDAVLLYAQAGSGRRANLFTDYTFGQIGRAHV